MPARPHPCTVSITDFLQLVSFLISLDTWQLVLFDGGPEKWGGGGGGRRGGRREGGGNSISISPQRDVFQDLQM